MRLSADDAREIARLLELMLGRADVSERPHANESNHRAPGTQSVARDRHSLVSAARAIFFERKRRTQYFSPSMFGEPAWDMLLALYISDLAGSQQTVGKLIGWVGEPQTTALRWIDYLEMERLIVRTPAATDRRIVHLGLTDKGRAALDDYFRSLKLALGTS